jgi:hypothetical protein
MKNRVLVSAAASFGLFFSLPGQAWALDCATLPNPLYVTATSLVKPYFLKVAHRLATSAENPLTIVYQAKSTCAAYSQIDPGSPMTGTGVYWDEAGEKSCDLPPAGVTADMALGDLSWKTCFNAEQPASVTAVQTFVQPVGFVVPISSTQVAITAEECNVLFRFGASTGKEVAPWADPRFIVIRNPNSSTQWLNGLACGVPGNQFSGNLVNTNSVSADVLAKVSAENSSSNAEKTIGILATDYYDSVRDKVKMLAFQSYKQGCSGAFLPDSSSTSFDKRNVRDGHYGTFGYTWGITKVGVDQQPASPRAATLLAFMSGTKKVNEADPIADAARVGLVPTCAMSVRRTSDGGELQAYAPESPCGCYFESVTGKTSCEACSPSGTCNGGKVCRFGFCEAR